MRSGHVSRTLAALGWAVALWCASAAAAQPHVACVEPENAELATRIRGQTRDLPIRLSYVSAQLGANPRPEQLLALAKQHAAQLVVQVSPQLDGGHVVRVYDAERGVLRKRNAPAPSRRERFSRSAAAETVALIVRGELTDALRARASEPGARAAGGGDTAATSGDAETAGRASRSASDAPSGPSRADSAVTTAAPSEARGRDPAAGPDATRTRPKDDNAAAASVAPPPSDAELASTSAPTTSGRGALALQSFALGVGLRLAYAAPQRLFVAPLLSLGLRFQHVTFAVSASTSLPDEARAEALTIKLREHVVTAELSARIPFAQRWELSAGPAAGAVLHERAVPSTAPDPSWLLRDRHTNASAVIGLRAELRLRLSGLLSVCVRGGFDYMLRPLRFSVAPAAQPTLSRDVSSLNALVPHAAMLLFADL